MPFLKALSGRRGVLWFGMMALLACVAASMALGGRQQPSLLETANKLGPAADSLVHGRGLSVCYGDDGVNCFRAQRMPVAPVTLAGLYLLFHEHRLPAALFKAVLCFAPVLVVFAITWRRGQQSGAGARWAILGLFLLALLLPPALDLVVNLNFEEAYFYGAFALAVALLLFPDSVRLRPRRWTAALWLTLVFCYLTKSSMLPAVSFIAVTGAVSLAKLVRKPLLAGGFLLAFACVPAFWGLRQHAESGRFAVGTSLDGVNLYKGNNPLFLGHYPAFRGASLDLDEAALFADRVSRTDEWDENDFGLASARRYVHTHPGATMQADWRKASVFFLGVQRDTGEEEHRALMEAAFTAGMVIFRIMLLTAIGLAFRQVAVRGEARFAAVAFLGSVACVAAPYLAGFALTRHATVLIFPAATYLCRAVCEPGNTASRET